RTATSNAGDGGGVIAAKDRPGNLTGASDQQVVAWAKQGYETAFRELVRRYERPLFSQDRKSTRLNSSHEWISYAVFCLKKNITARGDRRPARHHPGPRHTGAHPGGARGEGTGPPPRAVGRRAAARGHRALCRELAERAH